MRPERELQSTGTAQWWSTPASSPTDIQFIADKRSVWNWFASRLIKLLISGSTERSAWGVTLRPVFMSALKGSLNCWEERDALLVRALF